MRSSTGEEASTAIVTPLGVLAQRHRREQDLSRSRERDWAHGNKRPVKYCRSLVVQENDIQLPIEQDHFR